MTMRRHAAANIVPVVASNRIGLESSKGLQMTFYGSSFIAGPTSELRPGCLDGTTHSGNRRGAPIRIRHGWRRWRHHRGRGCCLHRARPQTGLRKSHTAMHQRGVERRQALLQAARELLEEHDIEAVSFQDIASRAGVPEGSACHFCANRFDLFSALAAELSEAFIRANRKPAPESGLTSRQALAMHLVPDSGAQHSI